MLRKFLQKIQRMEILYGIRKNDINPGNIYSIPLLSRPNTSLASRYWRSKLYQTFNVASIMGKYAI